MPNRPSGQMTKWLLALTTMTGVIPDLVWLAERSSSISYTYFCNPCVQHVSKLRHEGQRCSFRLEVYDIPCLTAKLITSRAIRWILWLQKHTMLDIIHH